MRIRVKGKGSITVFLSFILVLLFSLILTTLEAARLSGGRAYVQMVSYMAGDSARALYYYPLFRRYGLLGILAEDGSGYFSTKKIEDEIKENVVCALSGMSGGMLAFSEASAAVTKSDTIVEDGPEAFLQQIRPQMVLEGGKTLLSGLFAEEGWEDAARTGELYRKQEEALSQTATVTQELLRLMELTDGVATTKRGLTFDKAGKLKTKENFIKKPVSLSEEELKTQFKNEEVFLALKSHFCPLEKRAEELCGLFRQGIVYQAEIDVLEWEIENYQKRKTEIRETEKGMLSEEEIKVLNEEEAILDERQKIAIQKRDDVLEWSDLLRMETEDLYDAIQKEMTVTEKLLSEALQIVEALEMKQLGARLSVTAYEEFLKGQKDKISEELYRVFEEELGNMKVYAGMREEGYRTEVMKTSLRKNIHLLEELKLPAFPAEDLECGLFLADRIRTRMEEYTVDGLWFTYGTIVPVTAPEDKAADVLETIMTGSVLSFVGLSEEELPEGRLKGSELPSEGLESVKRAETLADCMEEMAELFGREGFLGILKGALDGAVDATALEWYARQYFSCFGEKKLPSVLSYEREYLLFGKEKDRSNLSKMVLSLIAIRSVFTTAAVLQNPEKMQQLETFAVSVAGCTGIPVLVSVLKYSMVFLWALEEAIVETAALMDGKTILLLNPAGYVSFSELFLFRPGLVETKIKEWKQPVGGFGYEDYLTVLSLLQPMEEKTYRMMDLIQENIRENYRDSFRMRNVVIRFFYQVETGLVPKVNTELWKEERYGILVETEMAY